MTIEIGNIANCHWDSPSPCRKACPFNLDLTELISKVKRGRFDSAYRVYRRTVGFPVIVQRYCERECEKVCLLRDMNDRSINIGSLERGTIIFSGRDAAETYNVATKDKKIQVVGAGILGCACALRLLEKHYKVHFIEKSDEMGGRLKTLPDSRELLEELHAVLDRYAYTIEYGVDFHESMETDADYTFNTLLYEGSIVQSIAAGFQKSVEIDYLLTVGGTWVDSRTTPDSMQLDPWLINHHAVSSTESFNENVREDIMDEAGRCLDCSCNACTMHCDMMTFYNKSPKRIEEEVQSTVDQENVDGSKVNIATQLIASCTQCGLCGDICEANIDLAQFILESRRIMHKNGRMPGAYYDFWISDMKHANSGQSEIHIPPLAPDKNPGRGILLFPGCQIGASDPNYVKQIWGFVKDTCPEAGILVNCCGAPAVWSGNEALHDETLNNLRQKWSESGKPEVLLICPSCRRMFDKYLPEISTSFVYDYIIKHKSFLPPNATPEDIYGIFDPCSSRDYPELQDSIRALLDHLGIETISLPYEREYANCCGFGGAISVANPVLAGEIAEARISQSEVPFITYCTNCRDIFVEKGKSAIHIIDILFRNPAPSKTVPNLSARRRNREFLKGILDVNCDHALQSDDEAPNLLISDALYAKMNPDFILKDHISSVISDSEEMRSYVEYPKTHMRYAHKQIGYITHWVAYSVITPPNTTIPMKTGIGKTNRKTEGVHAFQMGRYRVENAYCHRSEIIEENHHSLKDGKKNESEQTFVCGMCGVKTVLQATKFKYLGYEFSKELPRCPQCGQVYVPEDLATGRMREVESMLETK